MPIRVTCPSCGRVGQGPDSAIGRTVQCPGCQHRYRLTADMVQPADGDASRAKPAGGPVPQPQATAVPAPQPAPRTAPADEAYELVESDFDPPKRPTKPKPTATAPKESSAPKKPLGQTVPVPVIVGGAFAVGLISVLGIFVAYAMFRSFTNVNDPSVASGSAPKPAAAPAPTAPAVAPAPTVAATPAPPVQPAQPAPAAAPPPQPTAVVARSAPRVEAAPGMVSVADLLGLPDDTPAAPEPEDETNVAAEARAAAAAVSTRDDAAPKTLSTADIVAESEPSVALVKGKASSGTGFLIAPGLLATNAHVIDDELVSELEVRFVSADEQHKAPVKAELLYEDADRDLAFLAVKTSLKPLRVAKTYAFRKGEDITVIGNPGFGDGQVLENAISRGVMSTKAQIDNKNFYQLNIAINPGNSGGPVFDSYGRVIGVATLKSAKQEATGFSIPIEDVQAALAKVSTESARDADRYRSRHRITATVKGLGSGGALLAIIIDLRRAAASNNPAVKDALDKIEPIAAELDHELFPALAAQAPRIKNDPLLPATVKSKLVEMSATFTRLRTAYSSRKNIDDNQLRAAKQTYKRLLTDLSTALKLEVPAGMMTAFEDRAPAQGTVITMTPQNLGSYNSRLQRRMQNTPPSNRPPSLRDRMNRRGIR